MICTRCVLDTTVRGIRFDEQGVCNYCSDYLSAKHLVLKREGQLKPLLQKIKRSGPQACIVGISGGLDSSYLLYRAVELGLNPIAVHVDTGWNTETSVSNIEKITKGLNVPLKTYVLNWEQFRKIQIAYLKAGVIDLEFPTDHYYLSALYKVADDLNLRYILTGNNHASEGIMPSSWIHNKGDTLNMLDIYRRHGDGSSITDLPVMTLAKKFYYYNICRIENIFLLNYLNYNRQDAKQTLMTRLNWKEYPIKHGESVFTRFYHRYILPSRFHIDLRKAHLSSLICNQQLSRQEALVILQTEIVDEKIVSNDRAFVLKKLSLTEEEFKTFMDQPVKEHLEFRSEIGIKKIYNNLARLTAALGLLKISNRT